METPTLAPQLPLTLRAAMSNESRSAAADDSLTCLEQTATVLNKDAGSASLVRKSRTTAVQRETTDDT